MTARSTRLDNTKRKRADETLRKREELFKKIFDGSRDAIFLVEPNTRFLEVNQAACELTGYSRGELLCMSIPDLHDEEDLLAFRRYFDSMTSGVGVIFEALIRRKDGTKVLAEFSSQKMMFRRKRVMHSSARDITERKRSEELYKMLVDASPSSVLLIDQSLRVVLANRNFLERARRSKNDTIGKRLTEVFPEVILDEMKLEQRIRQVFKDNRATQGQRFTYRAPGVPMRVYYSSIIPVTFGTGVESVILFMDDITEQTRLSEEIRRVERHLASVVESASDIVLSTDSQGKILTWNKAAEKISGYTFNEVKEQFFFEYCARDQHEVVKMFFSNIESQKESPEMAECGLVTRDGRLIPVSWVFSPMNDDLARTVGVVVVGRDLTERRKFEMQLLQSQKLAALGVMAGGIAHEIRNPLAISSSAAQFLMEDDISPSFQKECAEKVYAGIERASIIIENLLKFARPSARSELEQVDLIFVLNEVLALIANQAKVKNSELKSHFDEEPVVILGIASLLQQVFMNLFLNGLDAMPNGGTLNVSMERTSSEVLVHIADMGRGIPDADIGKIFDPFYTTSPAGKGAGLGLSICYSVVKQLFGSIEVDSVEGKGSTFTVRLPLL